LSIVVASLASRIRALNSLWERAAADMTPEQVNHRERSGVLPAAFSFSHFITGQDSAVSAHFLGEAPLWERGDWARRVGVNGTRFARGTPVAEAERLRFGDLDAWRAYLCAVVARTGQVPGTLTEELLAEVVIPALPPAMADSYCALIVRPGNPVRKLEVLECFVYHHGLRHLGELEHARALVGLGGMTG